MKHKSIIIAVFLLSLSTLMVGQTSAQEANQNFNARLLLVDETKSFDSTMRVGALAKVLKQSGMVDLVVKMIEVESSYSNPLLGLKPPEEPYDLIVIIPRGIDDSSVEQIWIISKYYSHSSPEYSLLAAFYQIVEQVFQGIASATDVSEDLWPASYAALYEKQGWIK